MPPRKSKVESSKVDSSKVDSSKVEAVSSKADIIDTEVKTVKEKKSREKKVKEVSDVPKTKITKVTKKESIKNKLLISEEEDTKPLLEESKSAKVEIKDNLLKDSNNEKYYNEMKEIYAKLEVIKNRQLCDAEEESKLNIKLREIYTKLKNIYDKSSTTEESSKCNMIEMKLPKNNNIVKDVNITKDIHNNTISTKNVLKDDFDEESSDDTNIKLPRRKQDDSDSDSE